MNTPLFIAKRLIKESKNAKKNSQTIIKIAHISTILATIVMVLTIFISEGFQKNITSKIKGHSGDILISRLGFEPTYENKPVSLEAQKQEAIRHLPDVQSLKPYIAKPAIIKHQDLLEGIFLKAYEETEQYDFFKSNLIKGRIPKESKQEILVSEVLANQLNIDTSEYIYIYFIQNPIRYRKLKVTGIFNTSLLEFDKMLALVPFRLLKKINAWEEHQYSGIEVTLNENNTPIRQQNKSKIESILDGAIFAPNAKHDLHQVQTVNERYPEFEFWFSLFETNVLIIIFLMTIVALVNLVSAILILILENKNTIALLQVMGEENGKIKHIFFYIVLYLTSKGLFWGNILALLISFIQYQYQIIPLDAHNYYISFVPVFFEWKKLIILNIIILASISISLLLPINYTMRMKIADILKIN